jgi:GMP synthase (glutamine-hydrolysing)
MEASAPREPDSERSHPTSEDLELASYLEAATSEERPDDTSRRDAPKARLGAESGARETVIILDFGSQYSMLIARRVRECHVYCELVPHDAPWEQVERLNPRGFILSGGPASVYDEGAPQAPAYVFESGLPVLGICYGMQLLAHQLGGKVSPSTHREYGHAVIRWADDVGAHHDAPLRDGLPPSIPVWMSHGDRITELPPGFRALAHSDSSPYAVMANDRGLIGLQFHPEVVHTPHGKQLLENFLLRVCGCRGDWTAGNFIADSILRIREQIGDGRVICALSGGVDSAVTAALVHRAIGDQLTCIFVNNGLLRREEPERVVDTFHRHLKLNLIHTDATDRFLDRLAGVTDPEEKRRIVGETFIRVFEEESDKLRSGHLAPNGDDTTRRDAPKARLGAGAGSGAGGRVDFIAQGTTYPDVIESGGASGAQAPNSGGQAVAGDNSSFGDNGSPTNDPSSPEQQLSLTGGKSPTQHSALGTQHSSRVAATIKTHHNVGGLPKEMTFELVEPLRYLFKDEVRQVGLALGLPEEIVFRQPFPGPGLAIRIIGDVTRDKLDTLRACDWIVMDEVKSAAMYRDLWQAFAVLTDSRSVGVMGDYRTYGHVVAIRAVTAEDAMTADWARLPYDLLARIANRIVNEVPAVNRVVYDITSKPPGTIEWE